MRDFCRRLKALVYKEFLQLIRDKSSLLIGIVLPILLILLIGYGISLDVKNVPVAVVMEDTSPTAYDMTSTLAGSDYFSLYYVDNFPAAKRLMGERKVDAILRVPPNFTAELYAGGTKLQLILYGVDAATASTVKGYTENAVRQWAAKQGGKMAVSAGSMGSVAVESRLWFNDANSSTWYFVPGLIMLIMTIVGVFLTALLMAREWERGTLEALFISPVRPLELLLAKMIPYFGIAMLGMALCLLAARFLYGVPMYGSLLLMLLSATLYLFVALGIGLTISAVTKSQFLACQVALLLSFLPAMMLSGFLFDLRSVPVWISVIGQLLPPTYFLELIKMLFLAGDNWPMLYKNCAILLFYAVFFIGIALKVTKKRVE